MPRRHLDWMKQADRDFKHAEGSLKLGDFEWSCFAAQQAAEKAIKALIESRNGKAFGHSIKKLLELLNVTDETLLEAAARLDKHYIPTRYPNGYDSGAPEEYYSVKDAERAVKDAEAIIKYCKTNLVK